MREIKTSFVAFLLSARYDLKPIHLPRWKPAIQIERVKRGFAQKHQFSCPYFLKVKSFLTPSPFYRSSSFPPLPLSSSVSTDNSIISAKWPVQALCRGWIYWEQSENQNLSPGLRWPPNTHALFLFHTHSVYRTCCMYLLSANILEFIQTHTYEYWWMLDCCLLLGWPFHPTVKHFF